MNSVWCTCGLHVGLGASSERVCQFDHEKREHESLGPDAALAALRGIM
jgi:hypothetical protein